MNAIEAARDAMIRQARALWSWRQPALEGPQRHPATSDGSTMTFSGRGVVVTAAQDIGFFARSSSWRCTGCGRVHRFAERVPVVVASPCTCTGIEFEPHRDGVFATPIRSEVMAPILPA